MNCVEIPLLRESAAFSHRLFAAAAHFGDPRYFFHRRVNWSYRYAAAFYQREVSSFVEAPLAYLEQRASSAPRLEDVYGRRLSTRELSVAVSKVLAHWLFRAAGFMGGRLAHGHGVRTYRKCYVDDIELVFDPAEPGVLRAVYPFPISVARQWRYLRHLRRQRLPFKLDGNPYTPLDVARLLWRRDVRSLMRMESRAQIRQAGSVAASGVRNVQLSDEFDIGSLDFTRRLMRESLHVVNSAHGVGKYFPVHAYGDFAILTRKQERYYHCVRSCRYQMRRLNDSSAGIAEGRPAEAPGRVTLVFLSQTFEGVSPLISEREASTLTTLAERLSTIKAVRLFYKPHPNRKYAGSVAGFEILHRLDKVNGRDGTFYASFFSTCQIDPAFKGRKFLIKSALIHPEIAFDDSESILTADELAQLIIRAAETAAAEPAQARCHSLRPEERAAP